MRFRPQATGIYNTYSVPGKIASLGSWVCGGRLAFGRTAAYVLVFAVKDLFLGRILWWWLLCILDHICSLWGNVVSHASGPAFDHRSGQFPGRQSNSSGWCNWVQMTALRTSKSLNRNFSFLNRKKHLKETISSVPALFHPSLRNKFKTKVFPVHLKLS